jgi:hypothetical protein
MRAAAGDKKGLTCAAKNEFDNPRIHPLAVRQD